MPNYYFKLSEDQESQLSKFLDLYSQSILVEEYADLVCFLPKGVHDNSDALDCLKGIKVLSLKQEFAESHLEYLEANHVAVIENPEIEHFATINDPDFPDQHSLVSINAISAWGKGVHGNNVTVALMDTGLDSDHEDINTNYNGGDSELDYNGHGSHMAGIISASQNNKKGISGIAPQSKILSYKVLPDFDYKYFAICVAMAYLSGAKIINCSWGPKYRNRTDPILEPIIKCGNKLGLIFVFAAGNNGDKAGYYYPVNSSDVISVAAHDRNSKKCCFSNYGKEIDLWAPGEKVLSLGMNKTDYALYSGTSVAAAHVSGVLALLVEKAGSKSPTTLKGIKNIVAKLKAKSNYVMLKTQDFI